jgi:hypothetical protein
MSKESAQNGRSTSVSRLTRLNSFFVMHSTRREVLEAQAAATSLPLQVTPLPRRC